MSEPRQIRIGDAERDAAMTSLGEHMRAGRLSPEEYSERAATVAVARYDSDLAPLFSDLPSAAPRITDARQSRPGSRGMAHHPGMHDHRMQDVATDDPRLRSPGPGWRLAAAMPFLVTAAFFLIGFATGGWGWAWVLFLLIPASGAVMGGGNRRRRRHC